jgi:hypothetical protein
MSSPQLPRQAILSRLPDPRTDRLFLARFDDSGNHTLTQRD